MIKQRRIKWAAVDGPERVAVAKCFLCRWDWPAGLGGSYDMRR